MRVIRQVRKKESSLQLPATSLHLMQVSKFIEEYLHCQQKYMINLSAAAIHTHLPPPAILPDSFDIDLNVPYIESQHYDSRATFTEEHKQTDNRTILNKQIDEENFTDRQGFNSVSSESEEVSCTQRKVVEEEEEKYSEEDFQFIKHAKTSKQSMQDSIRLATEPNNSTKESRELLEKVCVVSEEYELQHLQETAYFLQERERVERRLVQESHQQQENVPSMNQPVSKKAIFLNKIQKEKSRKEIAQAINRERHHIKKFLK